MTCKKGITFVVVTLFFCASAHAGDECTLTLKPETSGFFLNPVLNKVIVAKVTPKDLGQACAFMINDEILQVNDQVVPGNRAKTVMSYWKELKKGSPRAFKVKRAGSVLTLNIK